MTNPRVLYVINSATPGGAEHGLLNLLKANFFEDIELRILFLHVGNHKMLKEICEHLPAGHCHVASGNLSLTPKGMFRGFLSTLILLWKFKPQVMVLSLVQSNIVGRLAAIFAPQTKVVAFEHTSRYSRKIYGWILKALSWRVNAVWVDNANTRESTEKYYLRWPKHSHHIPLTIVENITPKPHYQLGATIDIISIGRLTDAKDFPTALKAMRILLDNNINVYYHLVGTGPLERDLRELADSLKLTGHVTMYGYKDDWHDLASKADAFLLTSKREGMSLVTVEAMSLGMPIVATDVGGIQDYGVDTMNMLKTERTPEAVAATLERLLRDENLRMKLGTAAHQTVENLYSPSVFWQTVRPGRNYLLAAGKVR